jgi:hypothetical protein
MLVTVRFQHYLLHFTPDAAGFQTPTRDEHEDSVLATAEFLSMSRAQLAGTPESITEVDGADSDVRLIRLDQASRLSLRRS